jgi:ssDNA-binding Zn-finger/Zn-ribbon topoisomerase 1
MSNWVEVKAMATCKRCGAGDVAWQQGKTRKWYLCVARATQDGKIEADRKGFHKCVPFKLDKITDADIPF